MSSILFIDDDKEIHKLFKLYADKAGHQSIHAENGQDGLDLAEKSSPDLIVTDLRMPLCDGWSVIEMLREGTKTKDIPIIAVSSLKNVEETLKKYQIAKFIPKPLNLQEFAQDCESILNS